MSSDSSSYNTAALSRVDSPISIASTDSDQEASQTFSWPTPVWRRDSQVWEEWRHRHQVPPPTPAPTEEESHPEDWLEMDDLFHAAEEEELALARGYAEQAARIQQQEAQIHNYEAAEVARDNMEIELAERVAEITVSFVELGLSLRRARKLITVLLAALVIAVLLVCVVLLLK